MKRSVLAALVILCAAVLLYLLFLRPRPREASMLLINGVVYTLNDEQPSAEAIAIEGERIIGVGSTQDITSSFRSGQIVDLHGRAVYPGFIDSHAHLEGLGAVLMNLDVSGTTSVEEIARRVKGEAARKKDGQWLRGRGWDQNKWHPAEFPTHQMLDAVSGDVPVYLKRIDGHAAWVNKKVLELAHIDRSTRDPEGGKIIRDALGNPTGVFVDRAVDMLEAVIPPPSVAERTQAIRLAVQECLKVGLTEVHDMGVDRGLLDIYAQLIRSGEFPFRVYAAVDGPGETWEHYMQTGPDTGGHDGRLTVRALKMYADGALGSRGAALIQPYSDDPGNRGLTLTSTAELTRAAQQCLDKGFQLCVHAIGDRANTLVLNVYQEVLSHYPAGGPSVRFRVEHAQVLDTADIPRFRRLGVLPMMQPTHCTSDMPWVEKRLGAQRLAGAYAWRSLLDQGSIIPGGSDFPVESPNPVWGFYAAITRQDHAGKPEGGWHPEQRMTRLEALRSFTIWGAYAGFQEKVKGSIEPGKWADLTVLSDDIMEIDPLRILDARVEMTIVAGSVVYRSNADSAAWMR
jgi:predicted amidohydrolase YtcJ